MSSSTPAITSFTGGELSPRLRGRVDLAKYFSGCSRLENMTVFPHGGATRRSGLRFVAEAADSAAKSRLIPFEFNSEQTYVLEFSNQAMRVFTDGGLVLDVAGTAPYALATPYGESDLAGLGYVQSADTLILVHRDFAPRKLTRADHNDWSLAELVFAPQTPTPTGVTATASTTGSTEYRYRVTAQGELDESLGSEEVSVSGPKDLGDSTSSYNTISWDDDGLEYHYVYRETNGLWAFLGRSGGTSYKDTGDAEPDESTVLLAARNPFENDGDWPGCACFWNERLMFASTHSDPDKIWGSAVGSYYDFRVSPEDVEPTADESLDVRLSARQLNAITWMMPYGGQLFVGTMGGTWTVAGASGEVLRPDNAQATQASAWGSSQARPLLVEESVVYVQRGGRKVMEMGYSFERDAYPSSDITLLAEHITGDGVTELAYAQSPDCVVYAVRADGVLLACTYMRDQEVLAWSRIITDGAVESIAAIFDDQAGRDVLWAVVRRTVGGAERRYVEYLEAPCSGDIRQAFFVDCGVTFDLTAPSAQLFGLTHLAGRTVTILANGSVHPDREVAADGTLTLDRAASVAHVGLGYVSVLSPMPLEAGSPRGTSQSKRKLVTEVSVRFYETVGGKVGPDENALETIVSRTPDDPMDQPVPPKSVDKRVPFPGGWDSGGRILVVQDQALPMTVLLMVPTMVVNE